MEHLLKGYGIEVDYVDEALHVDLDKLAESVTGKLSKMDGDSINVVIGNQCHPEMEQIAASHGGRVIQARSCIDMLLGKEMAKFDFEAKTFYLTSGWLESWRKIFIEGLGWDSIDARQNFGYYDRVLLLDTGINPVNEVNILEFYEYVQVPVEIIPVDLAHLRKLLDQLINGE